MSELNAKKVIKHLKSKWDNHNCPMCHEGDWSVQDKVYELREYHGGDMVIGGSALIPVVPIICDNCGNIVLINGIIAGVVEGESEKDE